MKLFFQLIMVAYFAGNVYMFIKIRHQLHNLSKGCKIIFSILFWIAASLLFISLFTRDISYPAWLSKSIFMIGASWMVFTLYMVLALLATDMMRLIIPPLRPSLARYGTLCALTLTIGLLIYGYLNYRNPKIDEIFITASPKTDTIDHKKQIKIVAISDVHLGNGTGKNHLSRYTQMINNQKPDMILIAGDLIDNSVAPLYQENMAEGLKKLQAPMGIYMVPGNHEYISNIKKVEEFLKETPIQLLKDSILTLPCGITLIGRDDRSNKNRKSLEELVSQAKNCHSIEQELPIILLDHQPYELAKSNSLEIFLQISGHTHRGQVWPLNWLTDKIYEQSHGYRKWENTHIYVSSGLSLWGPPFRIGTQSDFAVITITI